MTTPPPGVNPCDPLFRLGYLDVTKPPYRADATGASDSTAAMQKAVEDGRDHQLVVFLPSGTYKVTDTIHCVMEKDPGAGGNAMKREFPTHIVGSRKGPRPKIVLADGSPGFGAGQMKPVLFFQAMDPDLPAASFDKNTTCAPCNYNQTLKWVEVVTGSGNPGATGVRMGTAQGGVMEDVIINATGSFAGIHDAPRMGGGTYNVEVVGGEYGAIITSDSRFLVMAGCRFRGQTKGGMRIVHHQPVVLAGCHFDVAAGALGVEVHPDPGKPGRAAEASSLSIVDTVFATSSGAVAISNPDLRNVYLRNVSVPAGGIAVRNGTTDWPLSASTRIDEYAYTAPAGATNLIDGAARTDEIKQSSPIASLPDYDSVRALHTWSDFISFEDPDVVNARDFGVLGDGKADDTAALQKLIDTKRKIFLPKGVYKVRNITLEPDTHLFGVERYITSLLGIDSTDSQRELVSTVDSPAGTGSLSFLHVILNRKDPPGYHTVVWRLGRNSSVHAVTVATWDSGSPMFDVKGTWVKGSGGGRFFGVQEDLNQVGGAPGFRSFFVDGTTEPLSVYGFSAERLKIEPMAEVVNAKNVRFFYFKTESGMHIDPDTGDYRRVTTLRITKSSNVALFGLHGNVNNLGSNRGMLEVTDSSDVLVTDVRTQVEGTTPAPLTTDWYSVKETVGSMVFGIRSNVLCNVFKRGSYR